MKHNMANVRCRADCTIRYAVRASVRHVWKYLYIHLSPDPLLEAKHVLREAIFQRAERESTQLKRIFDEECNKVSSEVAQSLAFGTIESSMRKCRKLNFPRLPTSAIDFADMLKAEEWAGFSETE
ncbi:uncharacterized protein LOC120351695 isoform X2 [Nilaparvata lugens]|uniref:uncharacterized protein LOC120351695 isoform X2 n=1 Tax=Nilaparvata lugens TaxID=108931 RepID=UPI00193D0505|nr:uncharacterized protein LOC120351695 isoform X2 [Nilaparvata lugens]